MRGDFSSFWKKEANRNFNGVLHQQGRVLLDRDWNAQTEIFNDWQETAAQDIIGAGVAAVPADAAESFKVTNAEITKAPDEINIKVNKGRVWADGLLIELCNDDILKNDVVRQATYFEPPIQTDDLPKNVRDAVILEAWHEELNAFQMPNLLIEPALGGVDTTERFQTAFRFRLFRMDANDTCDSIIPQLRDNFDHRGKLTAVLEPDKDSGEKDCPVVLGGGYTGFEHQLYRVEIAQTKHSEAYFKWSQFNGGLVGRGGFTGSGSNRKVIIGANLNAILHSDLTNFYLETLEEKNGYWQVTFGTKVTLDTSDNTLKLPAKAADDFFGAVPTGNGVFFRLWNDIRLISEFSDTTKVTPLQDGISLQFDTDLVEKHTPHDFWTFAVRAGEIGNVTPLIANQSPEGIFYHRVPLAEINWQTEEIEIEDCRRIFQPLTKLKGCCTYRVGDGVNSHGDFTEIQKAIEHLPKRGGEICVLPGEYHEKIELNDTTRNHNITIKGCGSRTRIIAKDKSPVIHVKGGINLNIESLTILAHSEGEGILLEGDEIVANKDGQEKKFGVLRNVKLENLRIVAAQKSAVELRVGQYVSIRGCQIFIKDENSEWQSAVYLAGDDLLFEENEIRVMSRKEESIIFGKTDAPEGFHEAQKANGGLHIAGGSERVRVINNLIIGGTGNGITLGSIDVKIVKKIEKHRRWQRISGRQPDDCDHFPGLVIDTVVKAETRLIAGDPLRDILIERNRIFSMGLNGIGVDGFFTHEPQMTNTNVRLPPTIQFITVENLVIIGNRIEFCLNLIKVELPAASTKNIGYGGIALSSVGNLFVRDNFIRDNGANFLEPVCGIFVLFGRGVEISRNHIINNGRRTDTNLPGKVKDGARGGIFMLIAAPGAMQNGVPALKLQENIVTVPVGRALTMFSIGNISITDNQFLTQSIPQEPNILSLLAASVLIFSLSRAKSSAPASYVNGREGTMKPPSRANQKNRAQPEALAMASSTGFDKGFFSGWIQFADNQCELHGQTLRGGFAAHSAILILSLDDVGFLGNQTNCEMTRGSMIADTFVFGATVRASDNSWRETPGSVSYSAMTLGVFLNTTTDNHSTECLLVKGKLFLDRFNLTMNDAAILSGDIAEIYKNSQSKIPCRDAGRLLQTYGKPRTTAVSDFKTTPNLSNIKI